jgi:hypothetical protein
VSPRIIGTPWARDSEAIWGLITHVVEQARVLSPIGTRVVTKASETGPLAAKPTGKKLFGIFKRSIPSLRGVAGVSKKGSTRVVSDEA